MSNWMEEQYYRQGELSWLVQGTERRLCGWNIKQRVVLDEIERCQIT